MLVAPGSVFTIVSISIASTWNFYINRDWSLWLANWLIDRLDVIFELLHDFVFTSDWYINISNISLAKSRDGNKAIIQISHAKMYKRTMYLYKLKYICKIFHLIDKTLKCYQCMSIEIAKCTIFQWILLISWLNVMDKSCCMHSAVRIQKISITEPDQCLMGDNMPGAAGKLVQL